MVIDIMNVHSFANFTCKKALDTFRQCFIWKFLSCISDVTKTLRVVNKKMRKASKLIENHISANYNHNRIFNFSISFKNEAAIGLLNNISLTQTFSRLGTAFEIKRIKKRNRLL